jgi:acetoin utilization deacetylase AcuC-like enzyme
LIFCIDFPLFRIYEPTYGSRKTLEQYHSSDYLDIIFNDGKLSIDVLDSFGLVDDCSIFDGLRNYSFFLGGAVNSTLKALEEGFRYVINWDGGRHHAQASLASGFCFINGN